VSYFFFEVFLAAFLAGFFAAFFFAAIMLYLLLPEIWTRLVPLVWRVSCGG
jgi:hypothetical protein